jgi:hypothetical protein
LPPQNCGLPSRPDRLCDIESSISTSETAEEPDNKSLQSF